jgi:hypothetical protein
MVIIEGLGHYKVFARWAPQMLTHAHRGKENKRHWWFAPVDAGCEDILP